MSTINETIVDIRLRPGSVLPHSGSVSAYTAVSNLCCSPYVYAFFASPIFDHYVNTISSKTPEALLKFRRKMTYMIVWPDKQALTVYLRCLPAYCWNPFPTRCKAGSKTFHQNPVSTQRENISNYQNSVYISQKSFQLVQAFKDIRQITGYLIRKERYSLSVNLNNFKLFNSVYGVDCLPII